MKTLLSILILFVTIAIANCQTTFEYSGGTNHEGTELDAEIRITVKDDIIEIIYAMPNTNFVEVILEKEYNISKYAGEMEEDEKGYTAFVWVLENNLIFSHMFKSQSDNWSMLSSSTTDGHTIFHTPF